MNVKIIPFTLEEAVLAKLRARGPVGATFSQLLKIFKEDDALVKRALKTLLDKKFVAIESNETKSRFYFVYAVGA